jgi:hypothetical protein
MEDEVCQDLHELDRRAVIMFALQNHESAISDRDNWRRTAAAILALHNDKNATLRTMAEHDGELNAVFHASRLIIEFAICECPLTGGREPGHLDMSRLMMKVLMISGLGGWSAAIHWEAMEPRLRVTALGDIHANVTFQEEIVGPYGRAGIGLMIEDAVKDYAENLEEPAIEATDTSILTPEFCTVLEDEFGAPLDALRKFIDKLENIGIEHKQAIFTMKRSELLDAIATEEAIGPKAAASLVEFLTFTSRSAWRDVPANYDEKDRFPWRFRRRLTVLRKPLLQIDESDDLLIITPGIARDALVYIIGNYHKGDFPPWQLGPKMRQWAGRSRDRIGHAFSEAVAKRMRELGWEAETEVAVTKLLRKGFDQNYGDVDVVAWRADPNRVLLMECKDVQHRKIEGEIAEQLADFRGELRSDGTPDHLLRHIRRLEVISAHPDDVANYVGFDCQPQIEGHLVFRHMVPMKFAWDRMEARMALHVFSELSDI